MKVKLRYITVVLVATLSGCSLFEPIDENFLGEDRANYDPAFAEGLLLSAYTDMVTQRSPGEAATDNATHNFPSDLRKMGTGEWSATLTPTERWSNYEQVLYANKFLTLVDNVQWKLDEENNLLFRDRMYGEAVAMRALRHFWIFQEHAGYDYSNQLLGIPYLKDWLESDADFNIPRLTFEECLSSILEDFDEALEYLPLDYDGDISKRPERYANLDESKYQFVFGADNEHRISGRIIHAFMAKLHLMAASPAFLNNEQHYQEAAALAGSILSDLGGVEAMDMQGHHNFYTQVDGNIPEYLWVRGGRAGTDAGFEEENFPPSLRGKGMINPTQNLVAAFPMSNGFPATEANGYNPAEPYSNRDPRLEMYILYNGNDLNNRTILTGAGGGDDELNAVYSRSTTTGYYLKKLLWEKLVISPDGTTSAVLNREVYFRYTELFLILAEAANEIGGPDHKINGISPRDVLTKIRERAGIAQPDAYLASVTDKEGMRSLIRNERRIELCFEGHRLYDLRRWGLLNTTTPIEGLYFDGSDYKVILVESRMYPPHGNYAPIPQEEVLKFPRIAQNNGW
jgi:hypothetical protein